MHGSSVQSTYQIGTNRQATLNPTTNRFPPQGHHPSSTTSRATWLSPQITSSLHPSLYSHLLPLDPSRRSGSLISTHTCGATEAGSGMTQSLTPFHRHGLHPNAAAALYNSALFSSGYSSSLPLPNYDALTNPLHRYHHRHVPAPPHATPGHAAGYWARSYSDSENSGAAGLGWFPTMPSPKVARIGVNMPPSFMPRLPPIFPPSYPLSVPPAGAAADNVRDVAYARHNTSASHLGPSLPSHPYYPSHFMRGTVIQLANGELKRVEDLNTEDFVRSSSLNSSLKMESSTIVKIEEISKNFVVLHFSVGDRKIQVSVESTVEHPFYVIGQGWSSCSPERTRSLYGLPVQQLQADDICISLTPRDDSPVTNDAQRTDDDRRSVSPPRRRRHQTPYHHRHSLDDAKPVLKHNNKSRPCSNHF